MPPRIDPEELRRQRQANLEASQARREEAVERAIPAELLREMALLRDSDDEDAAYEPVDVAAELAAEAAEEEADIRTLIDGLRPAIEATLRGCADPASGEVRMPPERLATLVTEAIERELKPEAAPPADLDRVQ